MSHNALLQFSRLSFFGAYLFSAARGLFEWLFMYDFQHYNFSTELTFHVNVF